MVFEDWELKIIEDCLQDNKLLNTSILLKIQQIRNTSVNKRYSLRTTDWLSESGKRRKGVRKNKITNEGNLI